jgi:(p)ppGpp synthase/HD superfamily hydrolase
MTATNRQVAVAEAIAREAHAGQTEKYGGGPYVGHLERVAALVEGDVDKAVAWLHDLLEDCRDWDIHRLREAVSPLVAEAVNTLTKLYDESYEEYIAGIMASGNQIAIRVKAADLTDHLRPDCPPIPDRLRRRYELAAVAMGMHA